MIRAAALAAALLALAGCDVVGGEAAQRSECAAAGGVFVWSRDTGGICFRKEAVIPWRPSP